ncbi:MAG: metalloregulator ArsR/SmtB family transcription factor, partial [Cyanobacteria bacterium REEB65]|nr:metalloregulator ArsR/SmtB family transcription factor [Cyanobacteria bacterium REEB65]
MERSLGDGDHSRVFAALSDPIRLQLLRALAAGERIVGQLARAADLTVPRTSHHLAILRQAGLVQCRRTGKNVHYGLPSLVTQLEGQRFGWGEHSFERLSVLAGVLAALQAHGFPPAGDAPLVRLAVASDLAFALGEILPLAERQCGIRTEATFGSTGMLEGQLAAGVPFDLFAAACPRAIDRLAHKGHVEAGTTTIFARGRLVLWHRLDAPFHLKDLR